VTNALQRLLIALYSIAKASGILNSRFGKAVFLRAYFAYKGWLEPTPHALKGYIAPGTWIIDVGANVGFYTRLFARWVGEGGKVLSIEPEAENFAHLQRLIRSANLADKVISIRAVASEIDGQLKLKLNPASHADHRIADEGVSTTSWRIDSLLEQYGWPRVSLIKIDVQGAEPRVLLGSLTTMSRFFPAVYMEIDHLALSRYGSSPAALIEWMQERGYSMHQVTGNRISPSLSVGETSSSLQQLGYSDFLFLPPGQRIFAAATEFTAIGKSE
jgi:FkbM family methyltransferase